MEGVSQARRSCSSLMPERARRSIVCGRSFARNQTIHEWRSGKTPRRVYMAVAVESPAPAQIVFRHEQDGRMMFYATTFMEGVDFELAFTDAMRLYGHEFAEQLREAIGWVLR